MRNKLIILVVIAVVVGALYWGTSKEVPVPVVPVTPVEYPTDDQDRIKVHFPLEGAGISSPLVVRGEARGSWYFEASFPVTVVNWDGLIIGEGYAQAKGDWMTTDYVPFEGTITYTRPDCVDDAAAEWCKRGWVIFQRDNPSGLPENDAAVEVLIEFQ